MDMFKAGSFWGVSILCLWLCGIALGSTATETQSNHDKTNEVDIHSRSKQWTDRSEQCTYIVVTHTGDIENADTDADVNVEFLNSEGNSVLFVDLSSGKDNFARGQTDTFTVVGNCVFDICKIHLSHDDAGLNASWFVNSVSVSMDFETHVFNIYEWLAKDEPPYALSYTHSLC